MIFPSSDRRHPVLAAVRKWCGWPRQSHRIADRWRAWASERREGLARLERTRMGFRMALLQPPRAGHSVMTRHSLRTAPTLHLTISPAVPPELRPGGAPARQGGEDRPAGQTTVVHRIGFPTSLSSVLAHQTPITRAAGPRGGASVRLVTREHRRIEQHVSAPTVFPHPTRLTHDAGARAVSSTRRVTNQLVTRMVNGHQRVELPARKATVLRQRTSVTRTVDRALTGARQRPRSAQASQPAGLAEWPDEASRHGPPSVDLEYLTDQILTRLDNRRTAHRERLGRVF